MDRGQRPPAPEIVMRARAFPAALLLLPALAVAADVAAPPAASGLTAGARVGVGVPYGDVDASGRAVRDLVRRKFPIWLELGYRFNPHLRAQLLLELSPATVGESACSADLSCTGSDVRFGLSFQAHLAPRATLDPWLGLGAGVEVMNAKLHDERTGVDDQWSWAGFELPLAEGGLDVTVARGFTLGPYVSFTAARFTRVSRSQAGGPTTTSAVEKRATHGWVQGGLKATLLF
jgi:hypothetical protein